MRKALLILVTAILLGLVYLFSDLGEPVPTSPDPGNPESASGLPQTLVGPADQEDNTEHVEELDRSELPIAAPAPDTLSGVVVDEAGVPVPGVPLMAMIATSPSSSFLARTAVSREDGTFIIRGRNPEGQFAEIMLGLMSRTGFRILSTDLFHEWGTSNIRIIVARPQTWILSVVEAETGRPVEAFEWRAEPLGGSGAFESKRQGWGEHEGGRAEMKDLARGTQRLSVFPSDEDLVPSNPTEFEVGPAAGEIQIALQRRRPLTVRVVRRDGTPVQGSEMQLLRDEIGRGIKLDTPTGPADMNFTGYRAAAILDRAETDAWGEVVLRGPGQGALAVKAAGPGHAPELVTDVSIGGAPLVIEVQTGATLIGTLQPLSVLESMMARLSERDRERGRRQPGVLLIRETGSGTERFPTDLAESVAIHENGTFRMVEVPPGSWEVQLSFWEPRSGEGMISGYSLRHRLVAVTDLADGETRRIDLDASEMVPGRIHGQILLAGRPYANEMFGLSRQHLDRDGRLINSGGRYGLRTDAEGRFSAEIEAGFVRVYKSPAQGRFGAPLTSPEQLHVLPGQTSTGVFHLVHRKMRVRFLEHDGAPATERYFSALQGSDVPTDADGWLVLDPAPSDPVSFYTWPKKMTQRAALRFSQEERNRIRITIGPVQLPAGSVEGEFTLRLPADRR